MPKLWRRREVLAQIESAYGTDSSPTGAANAILLSNATVEVQADDVDRELIRGTIGRIGSLRAKQRSVVRASVELAGSGAAGTPPKWGVLARACGMSETIVASTRVDYRPVSSGHESVTIYFFADGIRHRVLGARGTGKLRLMAGEVPRLEVELTGLYEAPTDVALPAGTYTGWETPMVPSKVATPTAALHGVNVVTTGLELDLGNEVVHRNLIGAEDVSITGRDPAGEMTIEAVPIATKNWWTVADNATLAALSLIHGTTAGNIVEIAASNVQIIAPREENSDGVLYHRLGLALRESAGDDDLTLTAR